MLALVFFCLFGQSERRQFNSFLRFLYAPSLPSNQIDLQRQSLEGTAATRRSGRGAKAKPCGRKRPRYEFKERDTCALAASEFFFFFFCFNAFFKRAPFPLTRFQCLFFVAKSFSVGTQATIVASARTSSAKTPVVDAETPRGRSSTTAEEVAAIVVSLCAFSWVSRLLFRLSAAPHKDPLSPLRGRGVGEKSGKGLREKRRKTDAKFFSTVFQRGNDSKLEASLNYREKLNPDHARPESDSLSLRLFRRARNAALFSTEKEEREDEREVKKETRSLSLEKKDDTRKKRNLRASPKGSLSLSLLPPLDETNPFNSTAERDKKRRRNISF